MVDHCRRGEEGKQRLMDSGCGCLCPFLALFGLSLWLSGRVVAGEARSDISFLGAIPFFSFFSCIWGLHCGLMCVLPVRGSSILSTLRRTLSYSVHSKRISFITAPLSSIELNTLVFTTYVVFILSGLPSQLPPPATYAQMDGMENIDRPSPIIRAG